MEGFPTAEVLLVQSFATNSTAPAREGLAPSCNALVLIVDDYQDCREMYAAYLTLAGFRVLKAANGPEAIAASRRNVPDLILMDLGLPGIDGVETTRRLKQDPVTRDIPVVALTAQCLPDERALVATGFESVITKPCRPDELAQRVVAAVGRVAP